MKCIAIINQKGGTGKTTTAINIAADLARRLGPDKVLLIDNDPQSNCTLTFLGPDIAYGGRQQDVFTILDVYEEAAAVEDALLAVEVEGVPKSKHKYMHQPSNLHILPSQIELAAIETTLNTGLTGLFILRKAIRAMKYDYEVMLIDCPANLGAFTMSALLVCSNLLVPVIPGQYEFAGLRSLIDTTEKVLEFNPKVKLLAVLPTRIKHTNVAKNAVAELANFFGKDLLLPFVQDRVAIEEAHFAGQDIFSYAPNSPSAEQYAAATKVLLDRLMAEGVRDG